MKKTWIFNSIILLCLTLPNQAWSYPYSEIYVFGDSLSDTGRLFEAIGIPSAPYYDGHTSNGPLWIEYLADSLNLTYNPQTNFAWVGALSGTANVWNENYPDIELWGLQQQIDSYIAQNLAADSKAIYIIWAGSNDFLGDMTNPQQTISTAITNLVTAVTKLRQHGAQHILVPSLPDLGKTARGIASGNGAILSQLTTSFNQALTENLQPLNVIQIDMPAALEVITNTQTIFDPTYPNLTNFTDACLNTNSSTLCDTPNQYFYWDDIHPSTQGHKALALFFYASIAQPIYQLSEAPILHLPVVDVNSETGQHFIIDATMFDDAQDSGFLFTVVGNILQSTKPLSEVITFPNGYQPPTFEQTVLHLPVVHMVTNETASDGSKYLEFWSNLKYTVDLTLMPNTLGHPFKAPLFELTDFTLFND